MVFMQCKAAYSRPASLYSALDRRHAKLTLTSVQLRGEDAELA